MTFSMAFWNRTSRASFPPRRSSSRDPTGSEEDLSAKFVSDPLYFEDVGASDGPGNALPGKFADGSGLGEIVDATRDYVFAKAWDAMQPHHAPKKVLERLDELVRRLMAACIRPRPRKERHEKNPRIALSVVGLDTLTGNTGVSHLVVRLDVQGQLLYIEDFEDGGYIDLFELRKNERRRMSSKGDDDAGLQSGSSYLYSLGRTSKPFGKSVADVMSACVQTEDGEPVIYPIF